MKLTKQAIYMVRHKATGALVPMIIKKVSKDSIIEKYEEYMEKRKGYTLAMLQDRWDKARDDVVELLKAYQVPGHFDYQAIKELPPGRFPADLAIFFEEYIFAIEEKEKMPHNKLKSKPVGILTEH